MVQTELICNSFFFGQVWWSCKNYFFTVSILGWCGGLVRMNFSQFLLWDGVVVLKELIFNSFYIGIMWWSCQNSFFTVSTLGWCGGPDRTDFYHFQFRRVW